MSTSQTMSTQKIIEKMLSLLGANNEMHLCELLGVTQSAISKWKVRDKIPSKYFEKVMDILNTRAEAVKAALEIHITTEEVADALNINKHSWIYQYKKNKPHLYELIENGLRLEKLTMAPYSLKEAEKLCGADKTIREKK
jgi:predicted transcriptional regulator